LGLSGPIVVVTQNRAPGLRESLLMRIPSAVVCACVVVAALAGCGSDKKKSEGAPNTPSSTATATTNDTRPASTTTTSISHPVVTDVFPTVPTLPCQPVPEPKTPVQSPVAGGDVYLTTVDQLVDKCVDHVIFGFKSTSSAPPGYSITYGSPPFAQDGSGTPVAIKGSSFIVVQVKPGYGFDFVANQPTYTGPKRIAFTNANHVTEVVETGDFEGVLTWVIGLDVKRPFTVEATGAPKTQLAVTVS
jgi:hypothetical protein